MNEYRCQICEALGQDSLGFRKPNGKHYVEAHHMIPVAKRHAGTLGAANIITICSNHHRELHYGEVTVTIADDEFQIELPDGAIRVPRIRLA